MGITFTEQVTLVGEVCISCGVTFAMPEQLRNQRRKDHDKFYCPNGHNQYYPGQSDEEKLRDALRLQTAETSRQRENYFTEQREHEKTQKAMQRLKKRTAAGTCPCCNRTFSQLARHMQTKHPGFPMIIARKELTA